MNQTLAQLWIFRHNKAYFVQNNCQIFKTNNGDDGKDISDSYLICYNRIETAQWFLFKISYIII